MSYFVKLFPPVANSGIQTPNISESQTPPSTTNDEKHRHQRRWDSDYRSVSSTSASGDDVDEDPGLLIDNYLSLQSRLYSLNSDVADAEHQRTAYAKAKLGRGLESKVQNLDSESLKLLRKIKSIKADILFDLGEANERWAVIRNTLAREVAERRQLQLKESPKIIEAAMDTIMQESSPSIPNQKPTNEPEDGFMIADLFSSLPDNGTVTPRESDGEQTIVRTFNQWSGISPRRVFEEACKAR